MPAPNWNNFNSLPGSRNDNFELLCRALIRLHFSAFGVFSALKNQPGVEFHLRLEKDCCALGDKGQWFGWQCKFFELTQNGNLTSASKKSIQASLDKTQSHVTGLTDWVLWTPFTLSKQDQDWFNSLSSPYSLHLWTENEVEMYLSGPAVMLRETYFGDLILIPEELEKRHQEAVQQIKERWLEEVHQCSDAEQQINRMLGDPHSWADVSEIAQNLKQAEEIIRSCPEADKNPIKEIIEPFTEACSSYATALLAFNTLLSEGDFEVAQKKLQQNKCILTIESRSAPRHLRKLNLSIALDATNALDDMLIAQELFEKAEEHLKTGLVAVLADAGGGKTQLSAQVTKQQKSGRPAGILLHGKDLQKGQTLDDLAKRYLINASPAQSFEKLLGALDAAASRAKCRLPLIIDGLNEAEQPRQWKDLLAALSEMIKRYPRVLVVCTLRTGSRKPDKYIYHGEPDVSKIRESFAFMALPNDILRLESTGFELNPKEAVSKYFAYYKINPGEISIPYEFFSHPLTLRIYCEVVNRNRQTEQVIRSFPASMISLFDKYVENACERISQLYNLKHPYSKEDVAHAVIKLGQILWENKSRECDEEEFKLSINDQERWDNSLVNLLVQEGIIFRNPGKATDFMLSPVYDALGGYIIAHALLKTYGHDRSFAWLKEQNTLNLLQSDESHELASDTFQSLVALTPVRISNEHLWLHLPEPLCTNALRLTTNIEPEYIDDNTKQAFKKFISYHPQNFSQVIKDLFLIRNIEDHPLNAGFLDSVLESISVAERDLSWTEWLREFSTRIKSDIYINSQKWKLNLTERTNADTLRMTWFKWLLSSTDHALRDGATEALYWFGRGDSQALFNETLNSLHINDPYIPERMLAASYGVAMARYSEDRSDFKSVIFPDFSRKVYDAMFSENALSPTTHVLIREYAFRIIELAIFCFPDLFSQDEKTRAMPPFCIEHHQAWGASHLVTPPHSEDVESPFKMDFENYTIGRLVPGRNNYDFDHEGYREVKSQILWRTEQLGWSAELFAKLDKRISALQRHSATAVKSNNIDRYGKKYANIAFLEKHGQLEDLGVLHYNNEPERTSYIDLDPSFPANIITHKLVKDHYLDSEETSLNDWIKNGADPELEKYLIQQTLIDLPGDWVALDGYISQESKKTKRSIFAFIRGFIISKSDENELIEYLQTPGINGRWLPEKPELHYVFAGEIPWSKTYPNIGRSEFEFEIDQIAVKKQFLDPTLANPPIKSQETVLSDAFSYSGEQTRAAEQDQFEIIYETKEFDQTQHVYRKFDTLIPVYDIEPYSRSRVKDLGHVSTLAKEFTETLNLVGRPQTFDLYTLSGERATLQFSDSEKTETRLEQHLFYIKKDILNNFLDKKQLSLIWVIWGKRELSSSYSFSMGDQKRGVFRCIKCYSE